MSNFPANLPSDFASAIHLLEGLERLDVEGMKLMVLLECAGEPLYARLAELVEPAEAKELLLQNGREETAHAHRLKKAIEIKTGETYELPSLDENPYAVVPPFTAVDATLLAGVCEGEIAGDRSYQRYADMESDHDVADLFRQNGHEESRHGDRVARVIAILGES